MKKIINKLLIIALAFSTVLSCKDPDNAIYDVFDGISHGAIIRTLDRVSTNYNIFDLNSNFEIVIEEQDEEYGGLLDVINVYVSYIDNTDDGQDNNKGEVLLKSISASEFTTSSSGLPTTTVSSTFSESLSAVGFTIGDGNYNGGDEFNFRLEVVLTDGRSFSAADGSGTLQGSYFQSPYSYSAGILCIPSSPITGDYIVNMQDLYGDGWQGSEVVCTIDGVPTSVSLLSQYAPGGAPISAGSATITVPEGASTVVWSFVAGDWPSEVVFEIIGPNSGNVIGSFGPSPVEGEFALNLCNE